MNQSDIDLLVRRVLGEEQIMSIEWELNTNNYRPDIKIEHALMLVQSEWFQKRYLVSIIQFPEPETQWLVQIENKKWDGNNELVLVEVKNNRLETAITTAVLEVLKNE
jgi:hypothetical protein